MAIPAARVEHQTPNRIRIRIPDRRGDGGFFRRLVDVFSRDSAYQSIQANPLTGSVLFQGASIDLEAVLKCAEKNELFVHLEAGKTTPLSMARAVTAPLEHLNRAVRQSSSGQYDLTTLIFVGLLITGIVQIMRGNFKAPPWYTAFWYAFGVFSKSLADKARE